MRKTLFILLTACFLALFGHPVRTSAQTRALPNAIHAKLNLLDYGALYDGDVKLSEGFEVGYFRNIAPFLNVGLPFKLGVAKLPDSTTETVSNKRTVTTSLDLVFHLENIRDAAKVSPYAFAGAGWFMEKGGEGHAQFPFGAGLNFRLSKYGFINVQGEFRKALVDNRDNLQLGLGFVYLLHKSEVITPKDSDNDGTTDALDKCPQQPGPPALFGCPDPDNDEDGLTNLSDNCPDEAGPLETNGCPDRDADGIADKDDDCPDAAGTVKGCPDTDRDGVLDKDDHCPTEAGITANQGCPEIKDADGDGVADEQDACPDTPGTLKGCPDADGDGVADKDDPCPGVAGEFGGCPDTDRDGVADNLDKCPTNAGPAANSGCPEVKQETKERLDFAMKAVQFKSGNALLKNQSFAILNEIVEIMKQYPDYKLVINGYTDNVGDDESNQWLSNERAKTCREYLLSKGVPAARLRSEGFGELNPIATNSTPQGRERNRRVEFKLTLE